MDHQPHEDAESDEASGSEEPSDTGVIGEIAGEEPAGSQPSAQLQRRSRRRSRLIGCLLALLGALLGGALAFWFSRDALIDRPAEQTAVAPADEARLPANRLVFSPTAERPADTPEIISAEADTIYCFYDLGRLPADAALQATWAHEGRALGDLQLSDHQPDETADHARGRFIIHPPETDDGPDGAAFAPGIYEVRVTSPDHPEVTAEGSFVALPRAAEILQGGGDPEGPPAIRSLQTAADVTDDGEPVDPASTFPADTRRITAVFTYEGIAPGSVLTIKWHTGDRELTRARGEIPITAANGRAEAWLDVGGEDSLPLGEYRVSVHLGDDPQPLATTGFEVVEASESPQDLETAPSPTQE
jgi:hypothetical protein